MKDRSSNCFREGMADVKGIFAAVLLLCLLPFSPAAGADMKAQCKACESTPGTGAESCTYFACPNFRDLAALHIDEVPGINKIAGALSKIQHFENGLEDDPHLLKALGLYLRLVDGTKLGSDTMTRAFDLIWPTAASAPALAFTRADTGIYFVGISAAAAGTPGALYLFDNATYVKIASGESGPCRVDAARSTPGELRAIIQRSPGGTRPMPDLVLLTKQSGAWRIAWTSFSEPLWIADWKIEDLHHDLSGLRVEGTTWGIRSLGDPECEQRVRGEQKKHFIALWKRCGDGYCRKTNLPQDAPVCRKLKEMEKSVQFAQ